METSKAIKNSHLEQDLESRFLIGLYETYLRLRDGFQPARDRQVHLSTLNNFSTASARLAMTSSDILESNSTNFECKRYINLVDSVHTDLRKSYRTYLDENSNVKIKAYANARIKILQMFENALFVHALSDAEAGRNEIDPTIRRTCLIDDRKIWKNAFLQSHQKMTELQMQVFGEPRMDSPVFETSLISQHYHQDKAERSVKKTAFIGAEVIAATLLWSRGVQPWLSRLASRPVSFAVSAAYAVGWLFFDRATRENLELMKRPPTITDDSTFSGWERLMKFGEEFVKSDLNSPAPYNEYLRFLSQMRRTRAQAFLIENQWELAQAEYTYGSVDAALRHLKEVPGL